MLARALVVALVILGSSSVAHAQWVLDRVETLSAADNNIFSTQHPGWSLIPQTTQPPLNGVGLVLNRNTPNEWDFGLSWMDPAASAPEHGVIGFTLRVSRTRCGPKTPACDAAIGAGFAVYGQSLAADNTWQPDGSLSNGTSKNGVRSPTGSPGVWANEVIPLDETIVYFIFNPFYSNSRQIRFIVSTAGAPLKTYYYTKGHLAPQAPILAGPPNGAVVPAANVQLSWRQNGNPGYAETFWVQAWYKTTPTGDWVFWFSGYFPTPLALPALPHGLKVAWQVAAVDPSHQSSPWFASSDWWVFTVQ